ncbi:hypothetical protein INT45_010072 [Circinella minor]|uniref:tRNA pseudouridine synthase n=1 Tax=Circinella minor TaxID=1195481 RepID=A0A8H7SC02_9FUNG|nr:hypothetical protein INT45_010072 [Circinella minor]
MLRNFLSSVFRQQKRGPYDHLSQKEIKLQIAELEAASQRLKKQNEVTKTTKTTRHESKLKINQQQEQRIAIQVAYLGWNYYGFTSSNTENENKLPTIEGHLMKALLQAKLIQDPAMCGFSLSGRTDRHVSGVGQVVGLNVRCSSQERKKGQLPYLRILNSILPPDIRVLAWTHVSPQFHARFDCRSRTYHYYFPTQDLCIESMKKAATYLLGDHDFRNFCKFNPSKNLSHYRRTILSVDVSVLSQGGFGRIEIKGTAFLWHQVRYIVSILLLVGQQLEKPEIVQWLLDVDKVPSKPEYPLASGLPLLLYDCEYNQNGFNWHREPAGRTKEHFQLLWSEQMTKALLYQSFVNASTNFGSNNIHDDGENRMSKVKRIQLGGRKEIWTTQYKPLMDRRRDEPYMLKQQKYNALHNKTQKELIKE